MMRGFLVWKEGYEFCPCWGSGPGDICGRAFIELQDWDDGRCFTELGKSDCPAFVRRRDVVCSGSVAYIGYHVVC
jgi:hypothetical protein